MEKADLQSAAAFVEGGIQDSCDDACSICLESFCENDPSTVTCCKHEFHLHCILEWCQRSSQCPMCWQAISLNDPTSQELLVGVERERNTRVNRLSSATIFHHPSIGDFELQHSPIGVIDSELEERIIQHLAAAAAMGRSQHITRREGHQGRSSAHGHPQFLVFSTNPNASSVNLAPATFAHREDENEHGITGINAIPCAVEAQPHLASLAIPSQGDAVTLPSGSSVTASSRPGFSNSRSFAGQSSLNNQDSAGPSDFQSFSESLKSRLSAVSMSTRGWTERFFPRNVSISDIGTEVRREVDAGIATVSRMLQHLDTRDNTRADSASAPQSIQGHAVVETSNGRVTEGHANTLASSGRN